MLVYWPEDVFESLASLKDLTVTSCDNLVGPAQVKVEPAPTTSQVLPHLDFLLVSFCGKLTELFVLSPSITAIHIGFCENLKFTWGESKSVNVGQVDTSTSLEYHASTCVPMQPAAQTNHYLPCLEYLQLDGCPSLVTLLNLPPALKLLGICGCPELCFVSGKLDALKHLHTHDCNKLQSMDSLGHLPSLVSLRLERCKRLTSLPGVLGSYSTLRKLIIKYCPAIDMKPLYNQHQQRLDSLEKRELSHAHSSDPREGTIQSIVRLFYFFSRPLCCGFSKFQFPWLVYCHVQVCWVHLMV